MSRIEVDFTVGIVSAFYFLVADLFLLTLADHILARLVNSWYYHRIHAGYPLTVSTSDIPGISTFLIGPPTSIPNIVALAIKLAFLACVFMIELGTDSKSVRVTSRHSRSATFFFNPSDSIWNTTDNRIVSRRWELVRQCRMIDKENENITFYHIVYDLAYNLTLDNELVPGNNHTLVDINDSTIACLSPKFVMDEDVKPLVHIIGCSKLLKSDNCRDETTVSRYTKGEIQLEIGAKPPLSEVRAGTRNVTMIIHNYNNDTLSRIFPEMANNPSYYDAQLTCGATQIGPNLTSPKMLGPNLTTKSSKMLRSCLLIVPFPKGDEFPEGGTLIERWRHDLANERIHRDFPGPIFKGHIDYGQRQRANHLINLIIGLNWETFAGVLIADAMIYEKVNASFLQYRTKMVTIVPVYAIVIGVAIMSVAVVARIIVATTFIGKDERPQLNSINGLSSVAREEHQPSGSSFLAGRGINVGLSQIGQGSILHFGPLLSKQECMKRRGHELVE